MQRSLQGRLAKTLFPAATDPQRVATPPKHREARAPMRVFS